MESFPRSHVAVKLEDVSLQLRIGLYAHEKQAPQTVLASITLYTDALSYMQAVNSETILDYAWIYEALKGYEAGEHVLLLETYIQEFFGLCFEDARVSAARVALYKPDILPDAKLAGLDVTLRRDEYDQLTAP